MFMARHPSSEGIQRFLDDSRGLPLSYEQIGLDGDVASRYRVDEVRVAIGRGDRDFDTARAALLAWKQFEVGWVETFPPQAPLVVGTVVAVLFRHLGFWSLNGCRVLYPAAPANDRTRFGFAYGTLTSHAVAGEELFEVSIDPETDHVFYRIRATSWPRAPLARIGQPILRALQRKFRRESVAAMKRAVAPHPVVGPPCP